MFGARPVSRRLRPSAVLPRFARRSLLVECGERGKRFFSAREDMQAEIEQYSMRKQTSVSLETLLDTGSGKLLHASRFSHAKAEQQKLTKHERTVMQVASFLRNELPVRLAHRAHELRDLPHGLSDMPSISLVQRWYEDSFMDIVMCPEIENLGGM